MSKSLNLLAVLSLYLIGTSSVHALSCRTSDASCSGQSATDCTSLGYSTANVNNCKHYLYCPFNINYKTCVAFSEIDCSDYPLTSCPKNGICKNCPDDSSYKKFTGCNSGYVMNSTKTGCELLPCSNGYARKADNCGIQGSDGWTLGSNKDSSGCYKCTIKSCPSGTYANNCDIGYSQSRSDFYSGDRECFICSVKPCPNGTSTNPKCLTGYKKTETGNYSGSDKCFKCVSNNNNQLSDCIEDCKDRCSMNIEICDGYNACVINCHLMYD